MPIHVEVEGKGKVAEFPDGTDQAVIDAAIKRDFFSGQPALPAPPVRRRVPSGAVFGLAGKLGITEEEPKITPPTPGKPLATGEVYPIGQDPTKSFAGNMLEVLTDPAEFAQQAVTGGLTGLITGGPRAVIPLAKQFSYEWLPTLLKSGMKGYRAFFEGLSAKAREAAFPVEKAIPITAGEAGARLRPPGAASAIERAGEEIEKRRLEGVTEMPPGRVMPWEEPLRGPQVRGSAPGLREMEVPPSAAITRRFPAMRKGLSTVEPTPQPVAPTAVTPPPQIRPTTTGATIPPGGRLPPTLPPTPPAGVTPPPGSMFVDERPLTLLQPYRAGIEKSTGQDLRDAFSGAKNSQTARLNYQADKLRKMVPDPLDREALGFYRDAGGDISKLAKVVDDPKFAPYRPAIERAINLPDAAKQANHLLDQIYKATGETGLKFGFLDDVRENYINRLWRREITGKLVTRTTPTTALRKTTPHALPRQYETLLDGIENGAVPVTTDAAHLLNIYSPEFSKVLTDNKLLNVLKDTGLSTKIVSSTALNEIKQAGDSIQGLSATLPSGYTRVGNTNVAVPDWLSLGLKAIIEPNFISRIDALRGIQKYQGLVKTIDLSLSLFHHFTMAMQYLYQSKFGWDVRFGLEVPKILKLAGTPDYQILELDALQHGLMTASIDANRDVLSALGKGSGGALSKVVNAPVVHYGFDLMQANNEFLFGKMQRYLKVVDFAKKSSSWAAKNPNATNEAIITAKRSLAREVNAAYGGLNWESLGRTPSFQSISRILFLAPDWTYSNFDLARIALTKGGPGGAAARAHFISALVGAGIITEGLNKIRTGHFTDENPRGHRSEVEVSPGVFVSFFRGGIGDLIKEADLIAELGPGGGTAKFISGKAAPFTRTAVGMLGNVDQMSRRLWTYENDWTDNTLSFFDYLLSTSGPIPFGVGQSLQEAKRGVTDPLSYALTTSGIGRPGPTDEEEQKRLERQAKRKPQQRPLTFFEWTR